MGAAAHSVVEQRAVDLRHVDSRGDFAPRSMSGYRPLRPLGVERLGVRETFVVHPSGRKTI
jgi:hypothetical protein